MLLGSYDIIMDDILQINERDLADDESIESFEYVEKTAAQSNNINARQAIDIVIEGEVDCLCPSKVTSRTKVS